MKRHSVFVYKIAAAYGGVFAAIMLLLTLLSYIYIVRTSRTLAIRNQEEFAQKAISQVDTFLDNLQDVSYRVMTSPPLLNQFNRLQRDARVENFFEKNVLADIDYRSILTTINGPKPAVWRISIYNQYGDYIRTGAVEDSVIRKERMSSMDVLGRMQQLGNAPNKMELLPAAADPWSTLYSSRCVRMLRPLMNIYSEEVYGIVEIQQDVRQLEKLLAFQMLTGVSVSVQDEAGTPVIELPGEFFNGPVYTVTNHSDKYNWSVTLCQSEAQMIAPYRPLLLFTGLGGIIVTGLAVYLIVFIARRLAQPLVALRETVGAITYNNMTPVPPPQTSIDEVRELQAAFETMVGRISDSVALEKEAMFQTLQSQMNPHFLYNVLTVIGAAGMEGNCEQVVKMCSDTCGVLRYTTSYERSIVTIGEELENMRLYLELMKARYEEYFTFTVDIPPSLLERTIPKMVLQPLTENCFSHGFHSIDPPYEITVTGKSLSQSRWQLAVSDNGSGFPPEEKAQILEMIETYSQSLTESYRKIELGGCGLVNTALRLRFNGKQAAALSFEEHVPRGTTVIITGGGEND